MGRMHHQRGCLNCGKLRPRKDIEAMTYDVMLKDEVSKSVIRVGLCPACFAGKASLDLDDLKSKLEESEVCFHEEKGLPDDRCEVFKNARFVGLMGRGEYWEKVKEDFPKGPKTSSDYLGVIANAR